MSVAGNEFSIIGATYKVPFILAGAGALFVCANRFARGVNSGMIYFVSYASFCIYLFHRVVFKYAIEFYFPSAGGYQVIYLLAFCLSATIILSYLTQKAYDHGVVLADRLVRRATPGHAR